MVLYPKISRETVPVRRADPIDAPLAPGKLIPERAYRQGIPLLQVSLIPMPTPVQNEPSGLSLTRNGAINCKFGQQLTFC